VLVVDETGAVTDVTVREGVAPFAEAAVEAVRTWTFSPATRDGTPIAARLSAVVTFRAPSPTPAPPPAAPTDAAPQTPAKASRDAPPHDEVIEIAVKGEHEELGSIHIPRGETRFVPGAFGDPFRVVEALPGMSPWLSGLPYYYVRGMPPESVGYYVDGIRIPLLFHVGSGPSTLAPSLVDSVDLFPAAYPARYGHFAGAVIAGETTPPDEERAHGDFQVRVFDAAALAETPFDGGQGTVLAAARYGYTGLITSIIDPDYSLAYWDYQVRTSHRVGDHDRLSLFVFGSYDELQHLKSPTFRVQYHRVDARYDHPIHDGHLRVAATFTYDDTLTAEGTATGTGSLAALKGPGARLRAELDQHVSPSAWVRAGADLGVSRFDVDQYVSTVYAPHTDLVGGTYADVVWRPVRELELVPGFRLDAYRAREQTTVAPQPRLSTKVKILPGVAWISAIGVAHQEPTDEVFVPAKLPTVIDETSRQSYQYSEAVEVQLPASMHFRATAFTTLLRAPSAEAEERSAGVELFLRRDFTQRLGGFVSYTLSRTTDTIDGRTSRAAGDRTHLLSVVLGYDLGRSWRVGGRFFFETGAPYAVTCQTPDCSAGQSANTYAVTGTQPAFYRVDVRLEKRWLFAGGRWLAGTLECFNALDKAEASGTTYSPQRGLGYSWQNPIILPSVGLEGGF
jgi:TonB family protein